jgi:hypothetical protein
MANWFYNDNLEFPSASPVSSGAAWVAYLPLQSTFAGGSGSVQNFYPLPPAGSQTIDCYIDTPNLQSISGGSNYVIPPMGSLASFTFGSGTICSYQMQQGSVGNWVTLDTITTVNAALSKFIMSDGVITVVSLIVPT